MPEPLPYKIAVLCYLFDEAERVLLLHRRREPNVDLYSPIGGKLMQDRGESPTACALREIEEETGLEVGVRDLHLTGIISEAGYGDSDHWLMFLYEVVGPVTVDRSEFREGRLEWHEPCALTDLPIPETDRQVIWPLFWKYRRSFFSAHIECHGGKLAWRLEQPVVDAGESFRSPAKERENLPCTTPSRTRT